jgi:hypothetical protein
MKMVVTEVEGKIVLTPQIDDPVDGLYGKLAKGESLTEALLADRAEERRGIFGHNRHRRSGIQYFKRVFWIPGQARNDESRSYAGLPFS